MNNAFMEFVLRMRDEASAGLKRVRETLAGTKDAAASSKPELDGVAGSLERIKAGTSRARESWASMLGTIGMVVAAFKAGEAAGTKFFQWAGLDKNKEALDAASQAIEHQAAAKKILADYEKEEARRLSDLNEEYDREAEAVGKLTSKLNGLAEARQKAEASKRSQRATQLGADERYALAQGYDPEAVKLQYADERRRAEADAGMEAAKAEAEAARRAVSDAEKKAGVEASRGIGLQRVIDQAGSDKAAAARALSGLGGENLTDDQRAAKRRALLLQDSKADSTISLAERELDKSGAGERSAQDALEVARAHADAAEEGVRAAAKAREAAEFAYQADVAEFFDKRDEQDRQAQAAALDALREQMAERKRLADEVAAGEHERRVEAIKEEASLSERSAAAAQSRLDRARSAAQQAWGWYRDPESFKRQLAEERADDTAEKRFAKDSDSLRRRSNWRSRELDAGDEAVRRVVLAREEERRSEQALVAIEQNTRGLEAMLRQLLVSK